MIIISRGSIYIYVYIHIFKKSPKYRKKKEAFFFHDLPPQKSTSVEHDVLHDFATFLVGNLDYIIYICHLI
jgi:hypothetical protein